MAKYAPLNHPIPKETNAQTDPKRSPDGIYSGMTKRLAISDNEFVNIQDLPKGHTSLEAGRRRKRG